MLLENFKNLVDSLLAIGFTPTEKSGEYSWIISNVGNSEDKSISASEKQDLAPVELDSAFVLQSWIVTISQEGQISSELNIKVNIEVVKRRLQAFCKIAYGPRTSCEFIINEGGEISCLFEFQRPDASLATDISESTENDTSLPVGLGGFRFQFVTANKFVRIVIADHFALGYLPQTFIASIPRFLSDALGVGRAVQLVPCSEEPSIYELPFRIECGALASIGKNLKYWTDDKFQTIAKAIEISPPSGSISADYNQSNWTFSTSVKISAPSIKRHRVPVEVLESRESEGRFRKVDQLFLKEQFTNAEKICSQFIEQNPRSIFLMRRMAFLGLSGFSHNSSDHISKALVKEPHNKLFISHEISRSIKDHKSSLALEYLSTLGECLLADGLSVETNPIFDLVFPELLGDSWLLEDMEMAVSCYERVIQKRGDLPRLLRKLINIRKLREEAELELELLNRLAKVENRPTESSSIFLRRAELAAKGEPNPEIAIGLCLQSLQFDRGQFRAALLAADLLNRMGRSEEAIELLSDLVIDEDLKISGKSRSAMQSRIATIWLESLARPDLAISRFESALEFDPTNLEALLTLERIFSEEGHSMELVENLICQFKIVEDSKNDVELWRLFNKICDLFTNILLIPERILPIFQRLLSAIDPISDRGPQVLYYDYAIDWQPFVQRLKAAIEDLPDSEVRGNALGLLAQILLIHFDAKAEATSYLLLSMRSGWLAPEHFQLLAHELLFEGDIKQLVSCLKWQLDRSTAADRRTLIPQILNYQEFLLAEDIDKYILECYSTQKNDQDRLQARLLVYVEARDFTAISKLFADLFERKISVKCEVKWLKFWNEILNTIGAPNKLDLLDANFRKLLFLTDGEASIYTDAIKIFKTANDRSSLAFFVSGALNRGILPDVNHDLVLSIFSDSPPDLALYYEQRALSSTDNSQGASWARSAAALFEHLPGTQYRRERMLSKIATALHCTDSTLEILKNLVSMSGNWNLYADAVREQIGFTKKRSELEFLKTELAFVYRYKTKEPELAKTVFESMLRTTDDISYVLLQLAEIGGEIQDEQLTIQSLKEIIDVQNPLLDLEHYCTAIKRLHSILRETSYLSSRVELHIETALHQRNLKAAGRLALCLLEIGVSEPGLWLVRFKDQLGTVSRQTLTECWMNGLRLIETAEGIQEYITETKRFLTTREQVHQYIEILRYAHKSDILLEMQPDARNELIYSFARALFDDKASQELSLTVFQTYHEQRPDDRRVWLPIYFLLREFGNRDTRCQHLERILPPIKEDPSVLQRYPITIESLEKELRSLRWDFGSLSNEPIRSIRGQDAGPRLEEVLNLISEEQMARDHEIEGTRLNSILAISTPVNRTEGFSRSQMTIAKGNLSRETSEPTPFDERNKDIRFSPAAGSESSLNFAAKEARLRQLLSLEPEDTNIEHLEIDIDDLSGRDDLRKFAEAQAEITISDLGTSLDDAYSQTNPENEPTEDRPRIILDYHEESDSSIAMLFESQDSNFNTSKPQSLSDKDKLHPEGNSKEAGIDIRIDEILEGSVLQSEKPSNVFNIGVLEKSGSNQSALPKKSDALITTEDSTYSHVGEPEVTFTAAEIAKMKAQEQFIYNSQDGGDDFEISQQEPIPGANLAANFILSSNEFQLAEASDIASSQLNDVEASTDNQSDSSPANSPGANESAIAIDWRQLVASKGYIDGTVERLLRSKFSDELEKHLALQLLAVKCGEVRSLKDWKWQSWRNLDLCTYPIGTDLRMPREEKNSVLQSPLFQLILALVPVMIRVFSRKYTSDGLAQRLQLPVADFTAKLRELRWTEGTTRRAGLHLFEEIFRSQRQRIFALEGLGSYVFYDAVKRFFYIDEVYYKSSPPSHLLHRILGISWSLKKLYFAPLQLHVGREVIGFMTAIEKIIFSAGTQKIKKILGVSAQPLEKILESNNFEGVKSAYRAVGPVSEVMLDKLWAEMSLATSKLQLAETMDLIGLFESLCDRDFVIQGIRPGEASMISPQIEALITFALNLPINSIKSPSRSGKASA